MMPLASKCGAPRPEDKHDTYARGGNIQGRVREPRHAALTDPFVNTRRPERAFVALRRSKYFL